MKRISVVLTDVTAAAPKPWSTRASTSVANDPAKAQPAEASVKSARPPT